MKGGAAARAAQQEPGRRPQRMSGGHRGTWGHRAPFLGGPESETGCFWQPESDTRYPTITSAHATCTRTLPGTHRPPPSTSAHRPYVHTRTAQTRTPMHTHPTVHTRAPPCTLRPHMCTPTYMQLPTVHTHTVHTHPPTKYTLTVHTCTPLYTRPHRAHAPPLGTHSPTVHTTCAHPPPCTHSSTVHTPTMHTNPHPCHADIPQHAHTHTLPCTRRSPTVRTHTPLCIKSPRAQRKPWQPVSPAQR